MKAWVEVDIRLEPIGDDNWDFGFHWQDRWYDGTVKAYSRFSAGEKANLVLRSLVREGTDTFTGKVMLSNEGWEDISDLKELPGVEYIE